MLTRRASIAAVPWLAAAMLAGCSGGIQLPSGVASFIKALCGVVVDNAAVAALIGTFPIGASAEAVAQTFCAALKQQQAQGVRLGGTLVQVNGRTVSGGVVTVNGVTVPYAVVPLGRRHRPMI